MLSVHKLFIKTTLTDYFRQCIKIFGEEVFLKIYAYLSEARSHSAPDGDEADMVSGLKLLTSNTRDCFLIDQLVFLERNTTTYS